VQPLTNGPIGLTALASLALGGEGCPFHMCRLGGGDAGIVGLATANGSLGTRSNPLGLSGRLVQGGVSHRSL